jgi:peptidoglycan/LPS O-acetylase OafA/YrhL
VQGRISFKDGMMYIARKYMRIAPVFYFVFFIAWVFLPYLGGESIMWYNTKEMYATCDEKWWANLLFISNIYPWFTPPNEGCYFWAWPILIEM